MPSGASQRRGVFSYFRYVGIIGQGDRHQADASQVRARHLARRPAVARQESGQTAVFHKLAKARAVLGTGERLDETDPLPGRMNPRAMGLLVVGDDEVGACDAQRLGEDLCAFVLCMLVQREQQQADVE